jgi:hypothetical protein
VLNHVVDKPLDLLLVGYAFGNGMDCGRVNLLSQVEQKVEIAVLEGTHFDVFVSLHVLLQFLLSRFVSNDGWKFSFLDDRKFVVLGGTMSYLDQQKFRFELGDSLASANERRKSIVLSKYQEKYFSLTLTCIFLLVSD